ncbi:MAG: hypothetical protein HQL85_19445 [Magnetococcales bacterium]|nr:hypothetical protein [Magnetococcales bacterium]
MTVLLLLMLWGRSEAGIKVQEMKHYFPPYGPSDEKKGERLLVREALHFKGCGDKAFLALVEGTWYWRHVETGKVIPLPQLYADLTHYDHDYYIGCSRDGMDIYHSNLEKTKDHGRHPGTTLFQVKTRRSTTISNVRMYLNWSPSGDLVAVIWSGMKPNEKDKRGIYVLFPKGLKYVPVMMNYGDLKKGEWIGEFFIIGWVEEIWDDSKVAIYGTMISRNGDSRGIQVGNSVKKVYGEWLADKKSGKVFFEKESEYDEPEMGCLNSRCYDGVFSGQLPTFHPHFYWQFYRQFGGDGALQSREQLVLRDFDQGDDSVLYESFLNEMIGEYPIIYSINEKSKKLTLILKIDYARYEQKWNNFPDMSEHKTSIDTLTGGGSHEKGLIGDKDIDKELLPPLIADEQGKMTVAQSVSEWAVCGKQALLLKINDVWYWRNIVNGLTKKLPSEIGKSKPVNCSPDSLDIFFIRRDYRGNMLIFRLQEQRLIAIAQYGIILSWSDDGKEMAMIWSYDWDYSLTEQPWIRFPEGLEYHPILLSPYRSLRIIDVFNGNLFQWDKKKKFLLGPNFYYYLGMGHTIENYREKPSPLSKWDIDVFGERKFIDNEFPVNYFSDWKDSLCFVDRVDHINDGILISGDDMRINASHYFCKVGVECVKLWNGVGYRSLLLNGNELWAMEDNRIGKIDWESGKIVCSVDADTKANFLDGRLIRTENGKVWLEKVGCP